VTRHRILAGTFLAILVTTLAGCLGFGGRPGTVVLYGRAAPGDAGWFGLVPAGDPPQVVGFGADGVGCLDGPPGTQVAWYDGAPGDGRGPKQIIGRIRADGEPLVLSVVVRPDGTLLVGQGVPAWWVGDPQSC
jgi:hypothetical protein